MNTAIIIAAYAAIGDDGLLYAARICNELQITENGVTYGDWYLPSHEELILIHQNKSVISATAVAHEGTVFGTPYYWSSTEISTWDAYPDDFSETYDWVTDKNALYYVRAIRSF